VVLVVISSWGKVREKSPTPHLRRRLGSRGRWTHPTELVAGSGVVVDVITVHF